MNILLIEDNEVISKGLMYALKQNNYNVICKDNIMDSIKVLSDNISLIILDISLPDGSGMDLYKNNISKLHIPTIFLSAIDDEETVVNGLLIGADDYITKPFSTRELLVRIHKILNKEKNNIIVIKDIKFDIDKMCVYKYDKEIKLTSLELKILYLLFINKNKVINRDYLIERIWEWTGNDINDNTLSVYLKRIRFKLDSDIIKTIKGIGYRIDEE